MSKYLKEPAAFPSVVDGYIQDGMTLRDYFAAKAMSGFLTQDDIIFSGKSMAECAYEMADAMLEARGSK